MNITQLVLCITLMLLNIGANAPPTSSKCGLWDSQCLVAKAQAVPSILSAGIPELGIPPLHTVVIDYFKVNKNGYQGDYRSMQIKGIKEAVIDNISVDIQSKAVQLKFHTDLFSKGRYVTDSHLFSMPIYGEGNVFVNFGNVEITMNINFDVINDVHKKHIMDLQSYGYDYNVNDGIQIHYKHLYNGDKHLSDKMHNKMHQNGRYLIAEYAEYLFDPLMKKIFEAMKYYVRSVPLDTVVLFADISQHHHHQ